MKISVCMATYNGQDFVTSQLKSILMQIGTDDELIISDDSSIDNTIKIINNFNDRRIKLLTNNKFRSPVFNFENALKYSTGDVIFLADQDDIWKPGKVDITMNLLQKYDVVISDCELIDEYDNVIADSFFQLNRSRKGIFKNLIKNGYLGCCMAFNRPILDKALPFPKNIPMHDMWLGMIGAVYGTPFFCSERLVSYRRHGNNASSASEKSHFTLMGKINVRYILVMNFLLRFLQTKVSQ